MSYPFPVTTFTTNQHQEIQRKYVYALLPKLGINRHMPRATIYAPTTLGVAALLDLRVLQPTSQLQTLQQHLRRQDATGMTLCANYQSLQVMVGSASPFLTLNPSLYKGYIDTNNWWSYIWNLCYDFEVTVQATFLWAPVSKYGSLDVNIMDAAVTHPQFQGQAIQLHAINACHLYLRVFYLSDMATYTGRYIESYYLDGTRKNSHPICIFPHQPNPTTYQWGVWRKYITGTFLCGHNKLHRPLNPCMATLSHNLQQPPSTFLSLFRQVLDSTGPTTTVDEVIAALPSFFQFMLQGTTFLHDSEAQLAIAKGISEGTLSTATDGSLLPSTKRGTNGVVICPTDDPDFVYSSAAPIPTSPLSSSLTAEHYGLITLAVILHIIYITEFKQDIGEVGSCSEAQPITVYIDNKETVKRGNRLNPTRLSLKEYLVPDYDLWELSNGIIRMLPFTIACEWVKSHQDDDCAVVDLDLPA